MGATAVVDAFWGDGGKGNRSAWETYILSFLGKVMVFRGCGGPGAEHGSFISGYYVKTNQLPLGFVLSGCPIGIGPGTAVDPVKLFEEMKKFNLSQQDVFIDYKCPIVTQENIDEEKNNAKMKTIGSTFSGTGVCMSHTALRIAPLTKDIEELKPYLADIPSMVNEMAKNNEVVLESSQGMGLSRYFGDYPNVTSVDVTTGSMIAGVGLDWRLLDRVILVVKALPTREGTGPMGDVEEFTVNEMIKLGIVEYSSILNPSSGKPNIRRKAKSIDWDILRSAAVINGATEITLTFAEHFDPEVKDVTEWSGITKKVRDLIEKVEKTTNAPVTVVNTGKSISSMVGIEKPLPKISPEMYHRLISYI